MKCKYTCHGMMQRSDRRVSLAPPTQEQIDAYNLCMWCDNTIAGASYQTGPRRGQQIAMARSKK